MAQALIIRIDADDPSDLDYLRVRAVAAVEEYVDEEADRFDGKVEVSWEWED